MARDPEKLGDIIENEPRVSFYWDDDFLGKKPSEGITGMLNGRETILKEDLDSHPIVLFADDMETCVIQTAAYYALRAGYSNIGDFLLHNLETDAVKDFLQDSMVRRVLKAEFDFISYNMRVMAQENDDLHRQGFEDYLTLEKQGTALIYAAGLLGFAEERAEAIHQYNLKLRDKIAGKSADGKPSIKVIVYDDNEDFGTWMYPKAGERVH
jgi:hypothetical protein